jgi:oxygen-dependent protoporphyrinogen oxidase
MTRIAIIGGGIAGLAAAYELEKARQRNPEIDWHLYEATNRLGGIVETTQQDGYILEGGPDAWVTEKPWARDLAIELGLENELVSSNDATRKTYILIDSKLQPIPDRMRMMVPEDLTTLENSPLFSPSARAAYAVELTNAAMLREAAPDTDESVASFVHRHFGEEVLTKIAAPLLSGVFGGDVYKLSVRSVMPNFVTMEQEHGSLIAALQFKAKARGNKPQQPIFTTLRNGLGTLTAALIAKLPQDRVHLNHPAHSLKREGKRWCLRTTPPGEKGRLGKSKKHFNHIFLATPIDTTRQLLHPLDPTADTLIPTDASSAILAAFAFPNANFTLPPGFGFLVPQSLENCHPERSEGSAFLTERHNPGAPDLSHLEIGVPMEPKPLAADPSLLAATFVTQKFPHRAPAGAQILRAFFGGASADILAAADDATIAHTALTQLQKILGPLPIPTITTIRRWPRSLPQYEVGHQARITQLDQHIAALGNLTLLGNAYHGVGLPDLIRDARAAVRSFIKT